jgi:predicted PilT family ATPase
MSETQGLPKLREGNKLIHRKKEIIGIPEELLKENESDTTDINLLIYVAATAITEIITKCGKTVKNTRNKDSWKIRIQRQISNWKKSCSHLLNQVQVLILLN